MEVLVTAAHIHQAMREIDDGGIITCHCPLHIALRPEMAGKEFIVADDEITVEGAKYKFWPSLRGVDLYVQGDWPKALESIRIYGPIKIGISETEEPQDGTIH